MSNDFSSNGRIGDLRRDLKRHLGETVTIFTTSGGESGRGFTGVLIEVGCCIVRLLSDIGPAPACALGSCCDIHENKKHHSRCHEDGFDSEGDFEDDGRVQGTQNRIDCRFRTTGAIVDIPISRIAAFVHNTVGGNF